MGQRSIVQRIYRQPSLSPCRSNSSPGLRAKFVDPLSLSTLQLTMSFSRPSALLLLLSLLSQAFSLAFATKLDTMTIKHVLVPIVMDAEARPFVEHLELKQVDGFFPAHTPFLAFDGIHAGVQVTVITFGKDKVYGTGVDNAGTVPASLATFLALAKFEASGTKVDLVLNAGTCGGFKRKDAGIGDVFLTTGVANHDRRIPIPGFDTYGIGKLETLDASTMAKDLGYKTAICTTGNSLDKTDGDDEIMKKNDASVKDMEAAAVAWVCEMNSVKYLGVKVVTDIVDGEFPTQDEFMENLHSAAVSLQDALPKVLAYMADKNHEEL